MSETKAPDEYVPPKVWVYDPGESKFASMNRPTAGARAEKELPVGKHPIQLYSLATPNGVKVTILLEELHEKLGVEYDAYTINIMKLDQFNSGFVKANPNSKIPAMMDRSDPEKPVRLFESGSIMLYLAEKYGHFIPKDPAMKAECMNWVFWLQGSAPVLGGGFGHFFSYAPKKFKYPIDRFAMEVKRQLDVLDQHLAKNEYMCGDEYTIADMIIWPWYGKLVTNDVYSAAEFLDAAASYKNVIRWKEQIAKRPAVIRGDRVNKPAAFFGADDGLTERHSAADFTKPAGQSAV